MRKINIFMTCLAFQVVLLCIPEYTKAYDQSNIEEIAEVFKKAVIDYDLAIIETMVGTNVCIIDNCYNKRKFMKMLRNGKSGLHKAFFVEKRSLRRYFTEYKVKISIHTWEGFEGILDVAYSAEGFEDMVPSDVSFRNVNGKWYIVNMYIY